MTKEKQQKRGIIFRLGETEVSELLAKQLCIEHDLPNGNYDIQMKVSIDSDETIIEITLRYNGKIKEPNNE